MPHAAVTTLIAFLVSAAAVAWLARSRAARLALDKPNERSLHSTPIPRSGGLGLLLGIACGWGLEAPALPGTWWAALAVVLTVSLTDDLRGLRAAIRMGAHLLAAGLATLALMPQDSPYWLAVLVVIGIAWSCNLYNFMDGSDGLAGGMALIGFGAFAGAAWYAGNSQFALLNLAVATAAAGFLLHNFHPARIFLGDAGAVTLGFLAATLGLTGWLQQDWAWWFPLLVFSPFIADASLTLARRALAGARLWEAHRDHYYQRLVLLGFGHRGTAMAEYALMLGCAAAALWGLTQPPQVQWLVLAAAAAMYAVLAALIGRAWQRRGMHAA